MFSLGELAPLTKGTPAIEKFKPWWERFTDYICNGILLLALVGWSHVISVGASGLKCTPKNSSNLADHSLRDNSYSTQRCIQEMSNHMLLSFPYFLLVQWILILFIQTLWLKLPFIKTKIEAFYSIFSKMAKLNPLPDSKSISLYLVPSLNYRRKEDSELQIEYNKLFFLLHDSSILKRAAFVKAVGMFILMVAIVALKIIWLSQTVLFQNNFICKLQERKHAKGYPTMVCNLGTGPLLYGIVIFSIVFIALICFNSLKALHWLLTSKEFVKMERFLDHRTWDMYQTLPGTDDLLFTLHLMFNDIHDSHAMLKLIGYCLKENAKDLKRDGVYPYESTSTDPADEVLEVRTYGSIN